MSAIADHVWQSTWFALAAWAFERLLRKDFAKVRCWIWLAASIKFLFPFALLCWVGHQFSVAVDDAATLLPIVKQVAMPLTNAHVISRMSTKSQWLLLAVWAPMCALLLQRMLLAWIDSRSLVRSSTLCDILAPIHVRSSDRIASPCVVGVVNPVLLIPASLLNDLTSSQLNAVLEHEMGHVHRNDNLLAYVHALIQALFWFHPLVWVIGARIAKEREHACDEAAIERGYEPLMYATSLLQVCKQTVAAKRLGVAYMSSGNLAERIRVIMTAPFEVRRPRVLRAMALAALLGCVAVPFASGMNLIVTSGLSVTPGARSIHVSNAVGPSFLVMTDTYVYGRNLSLRELIGRAFAVRANEVTCQLCELDHPRYDVEIKASAGNLTDQRQLFASLLERRFNIKLVVRK